MRTWMRFVPQSRQPRALALVSVLVVILHLLMAHTTHVQTGQQHPADHASQMSRPLDQALHSWGQLGFKLDCPIPNLLTPRVESLPALISMILWLTSALILLSALYLRAVAARESLPRPPGPTRQAFLQRFTL